MEIRFDTLAKFSSWFEPDAAASLTATQRWQVDSSGSTPSSSTGPGGNSAGPYIFFESSGNYQADLLHLQSRRAMAASVFPAGTDRKLTLRACMMRTSFGDAAADGLRIETQSGSSWSVLDTLEWYPQANNLTPGDTVTTAASSDTFTVVQNGGWVDFEADIPDGASGVRFTNWRTNSNHIIRRDAALWSAKLEWVA